MGHTLADLWGDLCSSMAQLHPEPEMNKEGHSSCHFLHCLALARSRQQRCTAPEQPWAPCQQRGPPCGHSTAPAASADSRKPGSGRVSPCTCVCAVAVPDIPGDARGKPGCGGRRAARPDRAAGSGASNSPEGSLAALLLSRRYHANDQTALNL